VEETKTQKKQRRLLKAINRLSNYLTTKGSQMPSAR